MNKVYNNIYELRKAKGLSQMDLADKLNINQDTYSKLERGKIQLTIERLELLAEIFGMTVLEIMQYGSETVQQSQIIDNEKVKELENKVLLLEKDLEICRNRYELKVKLIQNELSEIFKDDEIIKRMVIHFLADNNIEYDLIATYFTDKHKLVTELNKITFQVVLNYLDIETKDYIAKYGYQYGSLDSLFSLLDETEQTKFVQKQAKNHYVGFTLNFDWTAENYYKLLEDYNLLDLDFKNLMIQIKHEEEHKIYIEKVLPYQLIPEWDLKPLKKYKENPNYPPQTGFFRIENL